MILLIDGYNLLKTVFADEYISQDTKNKLINKLNNYSKRTKNKIVIIFDGGDFGFPSRKSLGYVDIIYAGYNESADDMIKSYIEKEKNKNMLLVSSDRELQKFASKFDIQYIAVLSFYKFLSKKEENINQVKHIDSLYKTTKEINEELDKLMTEISNVAIKKDNDIIYNLKNRKPNKLSKDKLKLKQKIKKL